MFGRSKKKQAAAQPQQMQVSPEALALIQAMQAGQQMQQQQMMMQQMAQQQMMASQQMPAQMPNQMPPPQMPAGQMPQMPAGQMPAAPAAPPMMSEQDLLAEIGGAATPPPIQTPQAAPAPQMGGQMPLQQAGQQMAAPDMAPAQSTEMPPADPAAGSFPFYGGAAAPDAPAAPVAKGKKGKLTKEEKRALATQKKEEKQRKKAEKIALASEKQEEKKRAKRRKKLAKTRFSRARYLREANGNAIAGVVLWIFIILIFIGAPFMLNTAYLIPQTNENMRIIAEVDSLKRSIVVNRPQITGFVEKRKAKQGQISAFTTSFTPQEQARANFENLGTQLEEAGLEVKGLTISPFPLQAQSIIGTAVSVELSGSYLDWLRIRNKFVRSERAISIPNESVSVDQETGQMQITAQIIIPTSR